MGEFFGDFFSFLIFSPALAAVFGVGVWLLPAVLLRNQVRRLRLRFFHFFVSGYVFIAIMTIYLLIVGSTNEDGGRTRQAGPFLGMLTSLVLAWLVQRKLGPRLAARRRAAGGQPGVPRPGGSGYHHPGYGHPG
ncbi:MAG: hypothetical protein IRZ08_20600, partial [Frankia sp.]|nr:hypothetical protein [Frankia sp.]